MRRIRFAVWALWLLGSANGGAAAAAGPDLSPRFELGAKLHYISESVIEHEIRIQGTSSPERITVRTESGMLFEVTDAAADGSVTIDWTLKYLKISATGLIPGIDAALDYDSRTAQASTSPLAPLFGSFVNRPVTVQLDATGRVTDFRGVGAVAVPGVLEGLLQGFLSREAFEQLPLLVTAGAPKSIRRGTKWARQTSVAMPLGAGSIVMDQKFKVKGIERAAGRVAFSMDGTLTSTAALSPAGGGLSGGSPALDIKKGSVEGSFVWDTRDGNLVSAETRLTADTELDSLLGRMRLGQTMSSSVKHVTAEDLE
jgi:hypothetical protein